MRSFALIVATSLVLLAAVPILASPAAGAVPIPRFALTILGETVATKQQFSQTLIAVSVVPIELSVTFHNNDTMAHSFTIDDVNRTHRVDTGTLGAGQTKVLNFTVLSMTRILYNGTTFTPEVAPEGGILFYCIPHRGAGMTGRIALAGVAAPTQAPEKGILLRAYWIGIIGIAAMLLWTIISYFIIKSSSRHFRDHSEHVRRGGP
jgi:hypothetical protein